MIFFIHNILDKLNQFFYKIENLTFDYKTIILLETMIILKFDYHINSISLKNIYKSHKKIEVKIEKITHLENDNYLIYDYPKISSKKIV